MHLTVETAFIFPRRDEKDKASYDRPVLQTLQAQLREAGRAFAEVFRNPNLRRVEISWAGTVCAYWIFIVTLGLYAYERGGAPAVGLVGLLRVLPSVVAAPFGAMLGDRYRRERVVVAINLARCVTIVSAAAAAYLAAPPGVVYALASVMGLLQSVFRPTQSALLPLLARSPRELTAANLGLTTIESVGILVGPAIGGVLVAVAATQTVFVITGGVFLAAALVLVGVSVERTAAPAVRAKSFLQEAFAGFGTVVHDARLRLIIGLYGLQTLVAGSVNVLIVVLALETLDLGKAGIGFLNSAIGVGGLLGGVVAVGLVARPKLGSAFGAGLAIAGLPIALIALVPHTPAAVVMLALAGLGTTIVDVAGVTLLQRSVPDAVLTRVMGVVQSVFVGTLGLGAVLAPVFIHAVGARWTFAVVGTPIVVAATLAWPRLRRLDRETAQAPANVDVLRVLPIFTPLPAAIVEQLARDARPLHVDGGGRIVVEGERGEDFYVILNGDVEVHADGKPPQVLRRGDSFGEIALLRDVPRTATVTALSPVDLLTIDRGDFLAAVTGNPESAAAAHAVAAARLGSLRPEIASA
jgi:MFS family permease